MSTQRRTEAPAEGAEGASHAGIVARLEQDPAASEVETYVADAQTGRFIFANARALANTGYTLAELQRMTPLELHDRPDFVALAERVRLVRSGSQRVVTFHPRYRRKDGSTYLVEHRLRFDSSSDPPVFIISAEETSIVPEEERPSALPVSYRGIVEGAENGIWIIDADAVTTYVNSRMAEMLGYAVDEMIGKHLDCFMDEEGKVITAANLERRRRGIREQHDFKLICKDGAHLWVIISANPIFDAAQQYIGAAAVVTDITARRIAEGELMANPEAAAIVPPAGLGYIGRGSAAAFELSEVGAERAARRFAVFADPQRLKLVRMLMNGEGRSVTALAADLGTTQPNVSKHLHVLAQAGIVVRRREGNMAIYALADPAALLLCQFVIGWITLQARTELTALAS